MGEGDALFFVFEGQQLPFEVLDERGLTEMGLLKLGELEMVGNQFFFKVMIMKPESLRLGLEELLGPKTVFRAELSLIFLLFEFFNINFVLVSFIPLFFQTLLNVL